MAKKMRKMLAMLLTLSMVLSMSIPAFATEDSGATKVPEAPTLVGNNYPLSKTATELKDD